MHGTYLCSLHTSQKIIKKSDTTNELGQSSISLGLTYYSGRVHLHLCERIRKVEEIGKFIRRYSRLSSEGRTNSSELSFHFSEVSFHSSEVLFRPSVGSFRFLVSYWGNSSGVIGLSEDAVATIALHSQAQSSYSKVVVKRS